ncbi:MAG: hypothetical protein OEY85_10740, partial [Rhodospirillales bacterium]|nr:hypothetical protein [Rhodospirillales bacterium]
MIHPPLRGVILAVILAVNLALGLAGGLSSGQAAAAELAAEAPAVPFVSGMEDLPLMPGLEEVAASSIVFDTPQGRIVETFATGNV